jgi:hypothetical protein
VSHRLRYAPIVDLDAFLLNTEPPNLQVDRLGEAETRRCRALPGAGCPSSREARRPVFANAVPGSPERLVRVRPEGDQRRPAAHCRKAGKWAGGLRAFSSQFGSYPAAATLENDFLAGALGKAGLPGAKR